MRPDSLHEAESRHSLTPQQFRELARGDGSPATLAALSRAEYSHRLLLFDLLMDTLSPLAGVTGRLPAAQRAWDLLAAAQRQNPAAVEELLLLPETGLWLTRLLTRLRSAGRAETPLWAEAGHLHTLAAVAAARARLTFSFPVPALQERVWLPTMGLARLPSAHRQRNTWTVAEVRSVCGRLTLIGAYGHLRLPSGPEHPARGWLPQRRPALGAGAARRITLDDLGHHRLAPLPDGAAQRLTQSAYDSWSRLLQDAYGLLTTMDPPTADAAAGLLRSLQPMQAHERFRVRSVSSGHGVGGLASSMPDTAPLCAATLVHELQHSKLSALMHLYPLHEPAPPGAAQRLYYAPWRDDPRPLGGMLQGAYAFTAVARFWSACAVQLTGHVSSLARFESALWLGQLADVLPDLATDPALTALGRDALQDLLGAVVRLHDRTGEGPEVTMARRMAADHRATWRLAHVRPHPDDVGRLAAAWCAGRKQPPALPPRPHPEIRESGARHLDARAMLVRVGLADPAALYKMRGSQGDHVPGVAGAGPADVLWACAEFAAARRLYSQDIQSASAGPGAWTGLGLALADAGRAPEAVKALTAVPEMVAGVHGAARRISQRAPDPIVLASWLGQGDAGPPGIC
ncbi:HEXXH motif domain-containing protein [Streptomyces sp. NBC_01618]|uniref:HEXXH motif domain-containing protein n=1 Tax=Streptomyces sp. NBC_01618 TaxID=2975900 RepID=UPI003864EDB6|nr:HEXXH motif domain-containing protein [Streptomyces sp. NBC_01618]